MARIVAAGIAAMALGVGSVAVAVPAAAADVMTATTWVNMRSGPSTGNGVLDVLAPSEAVQATGAVTNGWYQVRTNEGVAGWVYRSYLSGGSPAQGRSYASRVTTAGTAQLNSNATAVVDRVLASHPHIRTVYGWRTSSNYSSDHPNGRAVDIMVSNWSSQAGIDTGWAVARDFQANAARYNVTYIMWRQHVWNAAYPERGWRSMEDRGSATANHYDHVHVSVRA